VGVGVEVVVEVLVGVGSGVGNELFVGKKSRPSATLSATNLWAENLVANHSNHARAV
jgi:hypothetical protein